MTSQANFGPKPSYKAAKEAHTPQKTAQVNFQGGGPSYTSSRTERQKNFEITTSIKPKEDPGQGQKAGTGCNGGY